MEYFNRHIKYLIIIISVLSIYANPCFSQVNNKNEESIGRRFSWSFYITWTLGGAVNEIEDVMRSSGFGYTSSNWLFGGGSTTHPHSRMGGIPWMLNMSYIVGNQISVGMMLGKAPIMETIGYSQPQGGFGRYLFLNYSVFTIAPTFMYHLTDFLRVSVGPTYNTVKEYEWDLDNIEGLKKSTTFGFLADLGAKLNLSKTMFVELKLQYRFVGSVDVGPYIKEDKIGILTDNPSIIYVTFPKTSINFNHWLICLGVGVDI